MNPITSDSKVQRLKKQKELLQTKIKKAEALEAAKRRKQEKQLKFLIGEYVLKEAIQTGTLEELKTKLLTHLKRANDKILVMDW